MKKGLTDITILLDRTGSMEARRDETIGGFNTFVGDQRKAEGTATLTLVQFDTVDPFEVIYRARPIHEAGLLDRSNYEPRGGTPLYDALARTIQDTGKRLEDLAEPDRPERVIFVIITDGEENSSREFSRERVFEMLTHQRTHYSWEFVYLGCSEDAMGQAAAVGIPLAYAAAYGQGGQHTNTAYNVMSKKMSAVRAGTSQTMDWTTAERDALVSDEDEKPKA